MIQKQLLKYQVLFLRDKISFEWPKSSLETELPMFTLQDFQFNITKNIILTMLYFKRSCRIVRIEETEKCLLDKFILMMIVSVASLRISLLSIEKRTLSMKEIALCVLRICSILNTKLIPNFFLQNSFCSIFDLDFLCLNLIQSYRLIFYSSILPYFT